MWNGKKSRKMWNCLKATIWYFFGIYDAIKAFSCQLFVIADVTCLLWFHAEKSRFKNLPGFRAAHAASSWWAEHKIQNYRSWIEVLPDFPDPMPHRHHKSFRRKTELQKQFVVKVPNFLTLISRVDLHFVSLWAKQSWWSLHSSFVQMQIMPLANHWRGENRVRNSGAAGTIEQRFFLVKVFCCESRESPGVSKIQEDEGRLTVYACTVNTDSLHGAKKPF